VIPLSTIAAKLVTVPAMSFPRTITRIDRMIASGAPAAVVTATVCSDPFVSALLLGRTNAASGGDQLQLSSAVMVIGLESLRGLMRDVQPLPDGARKTAAGLWSLGNACGTMCRILARHSPPAARLNLEREALHVIGLIHDLGTIVALVVFPTEYEAAVVRLERGDGPFAALLKEELGADPCELGTLLARAWKLPALAATVIRHHRRPFQAEPHADLACLVHVARNLVIGCGFCAGRDAYVEAIDPEALARLELDSVRIERAIAGLFDEMQELELYEGFLTLTLAQ